LIPLNDYNGWEHSEQEVSPEDLQKCFKWEQNIPDEEYLRKNGIDFDTENDEKTIENKKEKQKDENEKEIESKNEQRWKCNSCTYSNASTESKCLMCGAKSTGFQSIHLLFFEIASS